MEHRMRIVITTSISLSIWVPFGMTSTPINDSPGGSQFLKFQARKLSFLHWPGLPLRWKQVCWQPYAKLRCGGSSPSRMKHTFLVNSGRLPQ
jgi:hypothetical protein